MKNFKKIISFFAIVLFVLSFVGCTKNEFNVNVKGYGSGSLIAKLSIEESVYNTLDSVGSIKVEDNNSFSKETINNKIYYSIQETKEYSSYKDLINALREMQIVDDIHVFEEIVIEEKDGTHKFFLKTAVVQVPSDSNADDNIDVPSDWLLVRLTISMPGEVTETNGEKTEGTSVSFAMNDFTKNMEYFAYSETQSSLTLLLFVVIVMGAGFVLVVSSIENKGNDKKKAEIFEEENEENKEEEKEEEKSEKKKD